MRLTGFVCALVMVGLASAAVATDPLEKCQASKLKTAGKYGFCRLKADAKAVKAGDPPDYSKCDEKYGGKWTAAETKAAGQCPVTGDAAAIQTQVTQCTVQLAAAIGGTPRFVDNGDGTISDNVSALKWEKKTELNDSPAGGNLHDADNTYRWSGFCSVATSTNCQPNAAAAAACAAGVEGDPTGCAECTGGDGTCTIDAPAVTTAWDWVEQLNAATFAGHSDWRLPTRQELQALPDFTDPTPPALDAAFHGVSCGAACTDITDPACSCTAHINTFDLPASYYWSASSGPLRA